MKRFFITTGFIALLTLLTACSDNKDEKQELLWQQQVDTLEKAKGIEQQLQKADDERRKQLEEMQK